MKRVILVAILILIAGFAFCQGLDIFGVEFKDQSTHNEYRVQIKNTTEETVPITVYYNTGQYVQYSIEPHQHELLSDIPTTLINPFVTIQGQKYGGVMFLEKKGNYSFASTITQTSNLTLGDVEIKDISTPNEYKVKVKNTGNTHAIVTFLFPGIPSYTIDAGDQQIITLNSPFNNIEVIVLQAIQISENNWEYSRYYGVIVLKTFNNGNVTSLKGRQNPLQRVGRSERVCSILFPIQTLRV